MSELFKRFSVGVLGAAFSSAANLLLSLIVLLTQTSETFGVFAFFQILVGFGFGAVNSIIGSPLSILIGKHRLKQNDLLSFIGFLFLLSFLVALLIFIIFIFISVDLYTASLYSVASFLMLFRWGGRTVCHANSLPVLVMKSDFVYSLFIFAGAITIFFNDEITIQPVISCLIIGSFLSVFFLGKQFCQWTLAGIFNFDTQIFYVHFKQYGRWSFTGVCATEITANTHAYIVIFFFGAIAYAPIAAAFLLFRPVMVVIMSLTQMERPGLAGLINSKATSALQVKYRQFSTMIFISFIVNVIIVFIFFTFYPHELLSGRYDYSVLLEMAIITSFIVFLRVYRAPISALIQASGEFKVLAKIVSISAVVAILTVIVFSFVFGVQGAMFGILISEAVLCILITKIKNKESLNE